MLHIGISAMFFYQSPEPEVIKLLLQLRKNVFVLVHLQPPLTAAKIHFQIAARKNKDLNF